MWGSKRIAVVLLSVFQMVSCKSTSDEASEVRGELGEQGLKEGMIVAVPNSIKSSAEQMPSDHMMAVVAKISEDGSVVVNPIQPKRALVDGSLGGIVAAVVSPTRYTTSDSWQVTQDRMTFDSSLVVPMQDEGCDKFTQLFCVGSRVYVSPYETTGRVIGIFPNGLVAIEASRNLEYAGSTHTQVFRYIMQPNNDAETFALTNCVTKDFKPCQSDSDQASPKFAIVDGTVWSGYLARVESFKLSARHKGYVDFSFAHDGTLAYELGDSRIKEWSTNGCLDGICAGDVVKYKTSHYNYNVLAVFPKAKKVVIKGIDQAGSKLESLILQDRHDLEKVR